MAKFPKLKLTKEAIKALQQSIEGSYGNTLSFDIIDIQLGDGRLPNNANIEDMTELINKKQTVQITSANANPLEGTIKITAINDNKTLDEGYYLREIGVFGYDYNNDYILIAYANAGDECDYIPDKSTPIDTQLFKIKFVIGNTDKLKITIKDEAFVTIEQFENHIKDPNAHASIFSKLKEWIKEIFATKEELKNHENYAEQTYLKTHDASEKYQPKGDYLTNSTANSRFLWEYNFKDKLLEVLGVRYSIEENGYICFGSLFGGLIIQWGNVGQYACDIQLPIKFPTTIFGVYLGAVSPEIGKYNEQENRLYVQEWSLYSVNNSGLSFRKIGFLGDSGKRYWIAIGR